MNDWNDHAEGSDRDHAHDQGHDDHQTDPPVHAHPPSSDESLGVLDRMEAEIRSLRSLTAERAAASLELEKERQQIAAQQATLESERAGIERQMAELEESRQRLEQERREADERTEAQRHEAEQRDQTIREQETALENRRAEIDAHEQRLRAEIESHEQRLRGAEEAANERAAQLEQREQELARRTEALSLRETELEAVERSVSSEHDEVNRLRAEVDGLREELSRARAKLSEASRQLSAAPAPAPAAQPAPAIDDEFVAHRKRRLGRYKQLLIKEAEKVSQIKEALKRKQAELQRAQEHISHKKSELEDASKHREDAERLMLVAQERNAEADRAIRRAEIRASKGRASVFVAALTFALAVGAAGAWFGVQAFVPATYIASARVALDDRGIEVTPKEVNAWRDFVATLAEDPQFLERASQRMRSRGFADVGTPTDLRRVLDERLDVTTSSPDEIELALRGQGAGPTERFLDTLSTAMVAYANDTRQLRVDQASSRVIAHAKSAEAPAEDPRLMAFGIAFGAAAGLILIGFVLVWRSLRAGLGRDEPTEDIPAGVIGAGLEDL